MHVTPMHVVHITCFGGPEVLEIVAVPEPTPGPGQQLYDVSTSDLNFADTHQAETCDPRRHRAASIRQRRRRTGLSHRMRPAGPR